GDRRSGHARLSPAGEDRQGCRGRHGSADCDRGGRRGAESVSPAPAAAGERRAAPVKILILAPYPPYPPHGGGTMRIYQIIRGLAQRHEVTCATFAPDDDAERELAPLRAICRVVSVRGPLPRGAL